MAIPVVWSILRPFEAGTPMGDWFGQKCFAISASIWTALCRLSGQVENRIRFLRAHHTDNREPGQESVLLEYTRPKSSSVMSDDRRFARFRSFWPITFPLPEASSSRNRWRFRSHTVASRVILSRALSATEDEKNEIRRDLGRLPHRSDLAAARPVHRQCLCGAARPHSLCARRGTWQRM